jgi:hypothetical protein
VNPPILETAAMTEMSPAEAVFFASLQRLTDQRAAFLDESSAGNVDGGATNPIVCTHATLPIAHVNRPYASVRPIP